MAHQQTQRPPLREVFCVVPVHAIDPVNQPPSCAFRSAVLFDPFAVVRGPARSSIMARPWEERQGRTVMPCSASNSSLKRGRVPFAFNTFQASVKSCFRPLRWVIQGPDPNRVSRSGGRRFPRLSTKRPPRSSALTGRRGCVPPPTHAFSIPGWPRGDCRANVRRGDHPLLVSPLLPRASDAQGAAG